MKDILVDHYAITDFVAGSPREVLKKAFQARLICGDVWMEMLQVRNQLSHDYDGDIIKYRCKSIVEVYLDKFNEFQEVGINCRKKSQTCERGRFTSDFFFTGRGRSDECIFGIRLGNRLQ